METMLNQWGYAGLFVMLFMGGFGLPIPEDIPLLLSGALIHRGVLKWLPALAITYSGVIVADSLVYAIGRYTGPAGNRLTRWMGVSASGRLERVKSLFERYGTWTVAAARFHQGCAYPCSGTPARPSWHILDF